jgi:hypothetical protein
MSVRKTLRRLLSGLLLLITTAASQQFDASAEQRLVQLINQERAHVGLPGLRVNDQLTQAARQHSTLMAKSNQLSHQLRGEPALQKRLAATGLRFSSDAENVAYDYSVQAAHDGLMRSSPHRTNIMNAGYDSIGIGVVQAGDVLWITQDFAHQLAEYSENDAENAIIAGFIRERQRAHQSRAQVVRMSELHRLACSMAKQGKLDARAPLSLNNVDSTVVYTAGDPTDLPPNMIKMAHDPNVQRFSVGACFASNDRYPAGVWWIVIVFL